MHFVDLFRRGFLYRMVLPIYNVIELHSWRHRQFQPPTPNLIKQQRIKSIAQEYHLKNFVETGTYMGTTLQAVKGMFTKVYSIEIDKALYLRAKKRFASDHYVHILHGDSKTVLQKVLPKLTSPTLYWLDAHFSGGITNQGVYVTPIEHEIKEILDHRETRDVILIDDADLFVGKNDYPTIKTLRALCKKKMPHCSFTLKDNIIRIQSDH